MDIKGLYMRYAPMVLRRCRYLLKDEERALDAMHDVFTKLLDNRERLEERHPSSLLYVMATRTCLDQLALAENRCVPGEELLLEIASSEDLENRLEARRFLDRLFHKQQESTRVIAVLHLLDGLTLSETAEEVGMSVSGVRKRLAALKGRLRTLVESRQGDENQFGGGIKAGFGGGADIGREQIADGVGAVRHRGEVS